jgi:hypothetical protein
VPRFRDDSFDDDFERPLRRKAAGRRSDATALIDPTDSAEALDGLNADGRRKRRDRDVGRRRHLANGATFDDREDEWSDPDDEPIRRGHKPKLADGSESFKCGHCKAFIGPTISGGRHRNHCPLCLYSRHVDDKRMGDRASECRALMAPIGYFFRPKGEQVVVHRCLGCGFERHNRVAADDSFLVLAELPELPPRTKGDDEEGPSE